MKRAYIHRATLILANTLPLTSLSGTLRTAANLGAQILGSVGWPSSHSAKGSAVLSACAPYAACLNTSVSLCDSGQRPQTQRNAVHEACMWGGGETVISLLLEHHGNPSITAKLNGKLWYLFDALRVSPLSSFTDLIPCTPCKLSLFIYNIIAKQRF